MRLRAVAGALLCALTAPLFGALPRAGAAEPVPPAIRRLAFPVEGTVSYWNDFGACRDGCVRSHQGNDLMGAKLQKLLATTDGTVTRIRVDDGTSKAGNYLIIEDAAGWESWYIHVNNDTPGTDDGANPPAWRFARGIVVGAKVKAGQHVAYMGDSGNAEGTSPHVHFELHKPDGTAVNPYPSLRLSQGRDALGYCAYPSNPPKAPSVASASGYWTLTTAGKVLAHGGAPYLGDAPAGGPAIVDVASTPTGEGYWLVDAEGGVDAFGDARRLGDVSDLGLNAPVIAMTPTPSGRGYWLLGRDGGIFSFGDAAFYGSTGALRLNAPIVGMAPTPGGRGYWLLGGDGGVFTFGDARFFGSTGGLKLNAPVISMVTSVEGEGYLLLGRDGGMFTFGDARYRGSLPGTGECAPSPAVAMKSSHTGNGYWILQANGVIRTFGDAKQYGDAADRGAAAVTIEIAAG